MRHSDLDQDGLTRVVRDLTPETGSRKSLVEDSRQITDYGRVLSNAKAARLLTNTEIWRLLQVVAEADLPRRIERIKHECERPVLQEVQTVKASDELMSAAGTVGGGPNDSRRRRGRNCERRQTSDFGEHRCVRDVCSWFGAFADYLVLLAPHGHNSRAGLLVDFMNDSNWSIGATENCDTYGRL